MSTDFGGCAMTAHPRQLVFILPKKVSAYSYTTDVSPDMAARHHDTKNNARGGILSVLLSLIMLVKPFLVSSQASQPQGPVKEPQKIEQSIKDVNKLNDELFMAIQLNNLEKVKEIIAQGVNVDARNNEGYTPLLYATGEGHEELARFLIDQDADVNVKDKDGSTPLFYAVRGNHKDLVKLLIAKGADINVKDKWNWTLLRHALLGKNVDILELLVSEGADVAFIPEKGYSVLDLAVSMNDINIARILVDHGAKFDARHQDGWTALRHAVSQGNQDMLELFVAKGADTSTFFMAACMGDLERVKNFAEKGADINTKDELGWTPLYWAASLGQTEVAKLLIDKGADVRTVATDGGIVLYQAVQSGANELVELLLLKGADVQAKAKWGDTSLHRAAGSGYRGIAELLIAKGAEIEAKDMAGRTPLHRAAFEGHKDVVEILITNGADVNAKDGRGRTPLQWARQRGHTEIVELLIDAHLKENARDEEGRTILHQVASEGWTEELHDILKNKPDVNIQDKQGLTPLHLAAAAGREDIVSLFLAHGGDINVKDNDGRTLLQYAVASGSKDTVSLSLAHGADIDGKDDAGRTLLHYAAGASVPYAKSHNNPDIVQLLLGKGINVDEVDSQLKKLLSASIDVNVQDEYGMTPLHIAASAGHSKTVELLIAQGARFDMKDNAGRAPIHYAAGAGSSEGAPLANMPAIIRMLLDNKASINAQDNIGWTPLHYAVHVRSKGIVQFLIDNGVDIDAVDNRGCTPYGWIQERIDRFNARDSVSVDTGVGKTMLERISGFQEIAQLLKRSVYYAATSGRDNNPGTLERPFRSIAAAIEIAEPGDSILIRGGMYVCSRTVCVDRSGHQDKPIYLRAYPGEVPVFDFSGARGHALYITGAYWHLKGLVITGAQYNNVFLYGDGACHNILEQVTARSAHLNGIDARGGAAYNIILNCDAYNNFELQKNGENGDGFGLYLYGKGNVIIGNRAWNNCDDGIDFYNSSTIRAERCYAWSNGVNIWNHPFFGGNGNGLKLGKGAGNHIVINCVVWNHPHRGFDLNANTGGVILRNCTGWNNGVNYFFQTHSGEAGNILRNNLSFEGRDAIGAKVDSQFNSWDADLVLTGDDFLSLDDSMMTAPRNPDGSIPQNNFLALAPGSKAIDKGVDIGMPFAGKRPDLGAFEYDPNRASGDYVKMLHQAVRDRDIKKIKELLVQGEGINDKDWLGYTPLQWAVYFGYPDVVELLLSQGADPDIQSDTGRFTLEIAKAMVYSDIEALLRKHGAKQ